MSDPTLNYYCASGTNAARMAFTPSPGTPVAGPDLGYFYYETDTGDTYSWDGAAWQLVGGGGTGTVTNTGTLTDHALIVGNGGVDVSAVGDLGTTTKLLHGAAAGDPTWSAVVEADITLADNTTNDVSSTKHGFAPKGDGTTTKFLNANGAYSTPSGGGGLVFLEAHTASASATLDFTTCISATYDDYLLEFVNIIPATDNTDLWMRMSVDGGATYDAGNNYSRSYFTQNSGTFTGVGTTAQSSIILANNINNTANWSYNGSLRLFNPGGANYKIVHGQGFALAAGARYQFTGGGAYESTTAVNAFRFLMSSGNLTSGTIRVYGLAKS